MAKRARDDKNEETGDETLAGDLVVDALGRRSPTPTWLAELGYAPPEETVVDAFLGYVTRHYRQPADFHPGWRMLMVTSTPPDQRRGGIIFPEENNTWVVMMSGTNKDYPPTDEEGFDAFARSLDPEYYAAVAAAEPIGKPLGYRGTESRWRHYEKLATLARTLCRVGRCLLRLQSCLRPGHDGGCALRRGPGR